MGIWTWIIGGGASAAAGAVTSIAAPFLKVWADQRKQLVDERVLDKQQVTQITLEGFKADVQFASLQQQLVLADAGNWMTRWIRPFGALLAYVWLAGLLFGFAPATQLPPVAEYLLTGILGSFFLLRPFEKNKRADIVAKAQVQPTSVLSTMGAKLRARPDREPG